METTKIDYEVIEKALDGLKDRLIKVTPIMRLIGDLIERGTWDTTKDVLRTHVKPSEIKVLKELLNEN